MLAFFKSWLSVHHSLLSKYPFFFFIKKKNDTPGIYLRITIEYLVFCFTDQHTMNTSFDNNNSHFVYIFFPLRIVKCIHFYSFWMRPLYKLYFKKDKWKKVLHNRKTESISMNYRFFTLIILSSEFVYTFPNLIQNVYIIPHIPLCLISSKYLQYYISFYKKFFYIYFFLHL